MLRNLLTFLFILVYTSPGARKLSLRHLTQKQLLSQSAVYTFVQNHQGFMWFGTGEIAENNKDIICSIRYARKIQSAILPDDMAIKRSFWDEFISYLTKYEVSVEVYWFGVRNELNVITAVDYTGHNVPGTFMTMIRSYILKQIVLDE